MDNCASCHPECHRRKHREPEWAATRVEMALLVLRSDPGLPHRLTVKGEEDRGDEDEHDLVNRAGDGKEPKARNPAQGLRDTLIPSQGPHGPNGSEAEGPSRPHGSSLGAVEMAPSALRDAATTNAPASRQLSPLARPLRSPTPGASE
jgi:hypothetical protein